MWTNPVELRVYVSGLGEWPNGKTLGWTDPQDAQALENAFTVATRDGRSDYELADVEGPAWFCKFVQQYPNESAILQAVELFELLEENNNLERFEAFAYVADLCDWGPTLRADGADAVISYFEDRYQGEETSLECWALMLVEQSVSREQWKAIQRCEFPYNKMDWQETGEDFLLSAGWNGITVNSDTFYVFECA